MNANLTQLAERYAELGEERSALEAQAKDLKKQQDEIKYAFIRAADEQGIDKFSAGPLTISVKEELKYTYDPEHWDELLRVCVESGYTSAIQRRCTSKVLEEMVQSDVLSPALVKINRVKDASIRKVQ